MRRIIVLTLIIAFISTLALAENQSAPATSKPSGYSLDVANYKVVVVTPLDKSKAVLISFFDKSSGRPVPASAYMTEGILGLAASQLVKLIAQKPDGSKLVKQYTEEMTKARQNALDIKSNKIKVTP
ncbi:MAG: hypothetical protein C4562_02885 [Actinobacteria bacterium]|nr:MAG: hypothetical protein C4562_02885 [Actinomycetota bacterium]